MQIFLKYKKQKNEISNISGNWFLVVELTNPKSQGIQQARARKEPPQFESEGYFSAGRNPSSNFAGLYLYRTFH